mmetsp:Transcript_11881/g.35080  ORF Transcript_11881/g.35080 Transcript_11881/m.35080 type:complete len:239 (+) Transcript_11881:4615-5331(+)
MCHAQQLNSSRTLTPKRSTTRRHGWTKRSLEQRYFLPVASSVCVHWHLIASFASSRIFRRISSSCFSGATSFPSSSAMYCACLRSFFRTCGQSWRCMGFSPGRSSVISRKSRCTFLRTAELSNLDLSAPLASADLIMERGGFQTHCSCCIMASLTWLKSVKSCAESWSCSRSASACMPASQSFTKCLARFVSATIFRRLCNASFAARASHQSGVKGIIANTLSSVVTWGSVVSSSLLE